MILPPWLAATAAWSLLLAYVQGSASNIGGFYYFANLMLQNATGHGLPVMLLASIDCRPSRVDRLARRENLGARDARDRSGLRDVWS